MFISKTFYYAILLLLMPTIFCAEEDAHLKKLFYAVKNALYSHSPTDSSYRRPNDYQHFTSNGISLGIYEALLSITKNDDLECVFRLLCEAAAGGRPGYSGRDINFDKTSLTKFVSYLNLGSKSSPFLAFAKAALLGISNRGDPYSCIINYSKCPRDQSRLLYYLNNHRGGFFQYFDKQDDHNRPPHYNSNYGYKHDYRPVNYKKNKIIFENSNFYDDLRKNATSGSGIYAQKYEHSTFKFPTEVISKRGEKYHQKRFVFPVESQHKYKKSKEKNIFGDPKMFNRKLKFFSDFDISHKFPKQNHTFFPEKFENDNKNKEAYDGLSSDRLPPRFHFASLDEGAGETTGAFDFKRNSFFPK